MTSVTPDGRIYTAGFVFRCEACELFWVAIELSCPFCANQTFTKEKINGYAP